MVHWRTTLVGALLILGAAVKAGAELAQGQHVDFTALGAGVAAGIGFLKAAGSKAGRDPERTRLNSIPPIPSDSRFPFKKKKSTTRKDTATTSCIDTAPRHPTASHLLPLHGTGRHPSTRCSLFFFNDTATTEIYTLSLHDALPILKAGAELAQGQHVDFTALGAGVAAGIGFIKAADSKAV